MADAVVQLDRSMSVRETARFYAVSPSKVRAWIKRGLLRAVDVGTTRQQLRITPQAIMEFERRRAVRQPVRMRRERFSREVESILDDAGGDVSD